MQKNSLIIGGVVVVAAAALTWFLLAESDSAGSAAPAPVETQVAAEPASSRPNILLVITDDIGLDASTDMYPGLIDGLVEHYGPQGLNHPRYSEIAGKPASTPVMNTLARQSTLFSNAWANPFCSPTRASILTGLYGANNGVLSYADPLSQAHDSFVRRLRDEAGYSTAAFGKWHMAGLSNTEPPYPGMKPKEAGFEIFKGNLHAAIATYWDYDYQIQDAGMPESEWRTEPVPTKALPGIASTTYAPVVKVADTIEWLTEHESNTPDKPWFVWFAFNLSHATANQQPSAMAVPNVDTLDDASRAEMAACGGQFGSNNTGTCSGEALNRAMTNSLDTILGKLLEAVDALDPNTYIIFVGDNGTPMYARPNLDFIDNLYLTKSGRGKGTAFESGARVPMLVKGPGIPANVVSDEYLHSVDLYPTTLALAGLQAPTQVPDSNGSGMLPVDGVSIMPILNGQSRTVRDPDAGYILTESLNLMTAGSRQVGARNRDYKVICSEDTAFGNCEFYNLAQDPLEEFPLPRPDSCLSFEEGVLEQQDPYWHFCHLRDVIATRSFL